MQRAPCSQNGSMPRIHTLIAAVALLLGSSLLEACSAPAAGGGSSTERPVVTVFAAASLTDVFREASRSFRESGHRVNVVFNFAGSQHLAGQLREGAYADVFASADETQMQAAIDAGRVETTNVTTFACNRLMVAYGRRPGEDGGVSAEVMSLLKLAEPGLKIVVGAEAAPIGRYTRQFLSKAARDYRFGPEFRAGFEANIVSEEQSVRSILSKLQLGEADAGVVYASDLAGETDLQSMEIPFNLNVSANYPIALIRDSAHREQAGAFISFLFSEEGAAALEAQGFSTECRAEESADVSPVASVESSDHAND